MTISSVTSKVIYVGTGSTAAAAKIFAYPFRILTAADLTVSEYNNANSTATVKVLTTDYDVSGVGDAGGGNVTITGSYTNLPTGSQLVIQRIVDLTQETDYVENDAFPAQTHENALDKLTMGLQQMQEQIDRAILADVSQTASNINVVSSVLAANSSASVAVAQAILASNSAASVDFSDPTFTGTTNAVTVACTLLTASTVHTSGDIYTTAWTDYSATSTVTGWVAFSIKKVFYKRIGNTVFSTFSLQGTSNNTTTSFTLPYINQTGFVINTFSRASDAGGDSATGLVLVNNSASTVILYKDTIGNSFSAAGTKIAIGQLFFETI